MDPNCLPNYLRIYEITARLGVARSTIYAWIHLGLFPKPVRIGLRAVAWPEAQIVEHVRSLNSRLSQPGQRQGV